MQQLERVGEEHLLSLGVFQDAAELWWEEDRYDTISRYILVEPVIALYFLAFLANSLTQPPFARASVSQIGVRKPPRASYCAMCS